MVNEYYFLSHQGWTDIINCLPIINYYSSKFELIKITKMQHNNNI